MDLVLPGMGLCEELGFDDSLVSRAIGGAYDTDTLSEGIQILVSPEKIEGALSIKHFTINKKDVVGLMYDSLPTNGCFEKIYKSFRDKHATENTVLLIDEEEYLSFYGGKIDSAVEAYLDFKGAFMTKVRSNGKMIPVAVIPSLVGVRTYLSMAVELACRKLH